MTEHMVPVHITPLPISTNLLPNRRKTSIQYLQKFKAYLTIFCNNTKEFPINKTVQKLYNVGMIELKIKKESLSSSYPFSQ